MKWFALHWTFGKTDYVKGESIEDAFNSNGYGGGCIHVLDYWEQVRELPKDKKEVVYYDEKIKDWREFGGLFEGKIKPLAIIGTKLISFVFNNKEYKYSIAETPFQYLCKDVSA